MGAETATEPRFKVIETDTMTGWCEYLNNMSTDPWSGTFTREEAEASVKWREENITRRYAYKIVPVEPHMTDNDAALRRHIERCGRWPLTDCGDVDCREAATRLLHEELDRRFAATDAGETGDRD
jgi:hypothetical protein